LTVQDAAPRSRAPVPFDFARRRSYKKPHSRGVNVGMRISSRLNTMAGYGAWLSIAAIAITAFVSSADAHAPFWIMAGLLVFLCVCIAIRIFHAVAGDVGLTK
jgi:hypothetical protein